MPCWGSNRSDSRGRSSRAIKFEGFWLEHLVPIFLALFVTFWLFFAKQLVSSFVPLSRQTNDNLGIFFSNFQGFTLVPWQKVGRIGLGFAGNHSDFTGFLLSFFPCIRTI
jgi:hypothetical protein